MAALLIAVCTSGCTPPTTGPLELGGEPGEMCVSARPGDVVGVGDVVSTADDADAITIETVSLSGAEHLELTGAYLVPLDGSTGVMSMTLDYPPASWADRVPVEGAVVPPGSTANVVATVKRQPGGDAHAKALTITYLAGGKQYEASGSTALVLADSCG